MYNAEEIQDPRAKRPEGTIKFEPFQGSQTRKESRAFQNGIQVATIIAVYEELERPRAGRGCKRKLLCISRYVVHLAEGGGSIFEVPRDEEGALIQPASEILSKAKCYTREAINPKGLLTKIEALGMNQDMLAGFLDISRPQLSKILHGKAPASLKVAALLFERSGGVITPVDLLNHHSAT